MLQQEFLARQKKTFARHQRRKYYKQLLTKLFSKITRLIIR